MDGWVGRWISKITRENSFPMLVKPVERMFELALSGGRTVIETVEKCLSDGAEAVLRRRKPRLSW